MKRLSFICARLQHASIQAIPFLLSVLLPGTTLATANKSPVFDIRDYVPDQVVWGEGMSLELAGVPLQQRSFTSEDSLAQTLKALSETSAAFQYVQLLPGRAFLSGIANDRHWLAELYSTTTGTAGYVSTMYIGAQYKTRAAMYRSAPTELVSRKNLWLPGNVRRVFSVVETVGGEQVEQHAYTSPWSRVRLQQYAYARLRQEGWQAAGSLDDSTHVTRWYRNGSQLTLITNTFTQGSMVLLHYSGVLTP